MELIQKLKARSLKKVILPVCLFLVGAVFFIVISKAWLLVQKPANLYDVPRDELEGKYVTVEVPFIYACYAYSEQYKDNVATGVITSSEYIIDANDNDFCGLLLPKDMVELGDKALDESMAYWNYETNDAPSTFTVTGVIEKMPEDSLKYYYETVGYEDMTAEDQEIFLPLYLVARDSGDNVTSILFLVVGLVLLGIAVVKLAQAASGGNQKQIRQKAEELSPGNPEYILQQADQLYENAPNQDGLRMNASLILVEQGAKQFLYSTRDLLWAYQNTTQHKRNGINTHKTYSLVLRMADGSTREVEMQEDKVKEQLQKIFSLVPGCVIGYSKELGTMYKNDRAAMAAVAAKQHTPVEEPAAPAEEAPEEAPQA